MREDTHLFVPTVLLRGIKIQKIVKKKKGLKALIDVFPVVCVVAVVAVVRLKTTQGTLLMSNVQTQMFVSACALALWAARGFTLVRL